MVPAIPYSAHTVIFPALFCEPSLRQYYHNVLCFFGCFTHSCRYLFVASALPQPFCCIAIVAIAIIYFIGLWIRQLFSWPKRDKSSPFPAPPRALTGHGAMPVYGHTSLFADRAGDCATLFDPHDLTVRWLPWSRPLGDCFAMFFWGQWRVVVKGPKRAEMVFKSQELKESWPWSPPITLLGKTCFAFLEEDESEHLRRLLGRPLSHRQVVSYAPQFAQQAEKCLSDICAGAFTKRPASSNRRDFDDHHRGSNNLDDSTHGGVANGGYINDDDDGFDSTFKLKWDAFRSYTFDLVDGPVLGLNIWNNNDSSKRSLKSDFVDVETGNDRASKTKKEKHEDMPCRETMLLYMERMKRGVDVIKTTFGPEWMYIWILNEYGRALNSRMHVEKVMLKHIAEVVARFPEVTHKLGHAYHDPTTQAIPLLTMGQNLLRSKEGIFGDAKVQPQFGAGRPRSRSMPGGSSFIDSGWTSSDDELLGYESGDNGVGSRLSMDLDLARPRSTSVDVLDLQRSKISLTQAASQASALAAVDEFNARQNVSRSRSEKLGSQDDMSPALASPSTHRTARDWRKAMRDELASLDAPVTPTTVGVVAPPPDPERPLLQSKRVTVQHKSGISMLTVLERLMKQHDMAGNGLSQVVATDIAILLWMMMEVGNAWTAMALSLISADSATMSLVQDEIDHIEQTYGKDDIFSPGALARMKYLDALLYEAIRLCPPNLGGMKKTTETIELKDVGVQIPKDSNIFFCRPTDMHFDIHAAVGKKPENLGRLYPCMELYVVTAVL